MMAKPRDGEAETKRILVRNPPKTGAQQRIKHQEEHTIFGQRGSLLLVEISQNLAQFIHVDLTVSTHVVLFHQSLFIRTNHGQAVSGRMQLDRIAEQIIANSNLPSRVAGRLCRQATSISAFFFFKLAVCLPLLRATISPSLPALCSGERETLQWTSVWTLIRPGTPIALLTDDAPLFQQWFISFQKSRNRVSSYEPDEGSKASHDFRRFESVAIPLPFCLSVPEAASQAAHSVLRGGALAPRARARARARAC